jgi:hypothetical protein
MLGEAELEHDVGMDPPITAATTTATSTELRVNSRASGGFAETMSTGTVVSGELIERPRGER